MDFPTASLNASFPQDCQRQRQLSWQQRQQQHMSLFNLSSSGTDNDFGDLDLHQILDRAEKIVAATGGHGQQQNVVQVHHQEGEHQDSSAAAAVQEEDDAMCVDTLYNMIYHPVTGPARASSSKASRHHRQVQHQQTMVNNDDAFEPIPLGPKSCQNIISAPTAAMVDTKKGFSSLPPPPPPPMEMAMVSPDHRTQGYNFFAGPEEVVSSSSVVVGGGEVTTHVVSIDDHMDILSSVFDVDNDDDDEDLEPLTPSPASTVSLASLGSSSSKSTLSPRRKKSSSSATTIRKYQTSQWEERFQELLQFKECHGHMFVPHSYPPNQKLAQWVKRQRYQFRLKSLGKHSTLSDDREQILSDVGFVYDSHAAVWNEKFQQLQRFALEFGHCNVPATYLNDASLSVWCKHQRRQFKALVKMNKSGMKTDSPKSSSSSASATTTITPERIELLDSIGFDWNPRNLKH